MFSPTHVVPQQFLNNPAYNACPKICLDSPVNNAGEDVNGCSVDSIGLKNLAVHKGTI